MRLESSFKPEPFAWPSEQEWEGEVTRSSPEYGRWVQSSLKQLLGLRLAVDGIIGPATRSAVRTFQQQKRLTVDGIVGPITEAALLAAGASPPPVSVSATATGGGAPVVPPECASPGGETCIVLEEFDQGDDTLTQPHEELVKSLAERVVTRWESHSLLLLGRASVEGSEALNYDLAMRRAEEVEFALAGAMEDIQRGSSRWIEMVSKSCGETPIKGISTLERQRRVDVCFAPVPKWFDTDRAARMQPVRAGNDVRYFVGPVANGRETFKEMVAAMRTARTNGHYIYLLGWWLSTDFELIERNVMTTVHALFRDANASGVQIRVMLWDQWGDQNRKEWQEINALSRGAAIHDNRVLTSDVTGANIGSHHQKVLIVKGEEGLIGFCGGVDINPDRIRETGDTPGAPFHDVHVRVQGPAAHDLLKIFVERWQDHPDSAAYDAAKGSLLGVPDDPSRQTIPLKPAGNVYVQVGRTYGNGSRHGGVAGGYRFAPAGEQTARRMILKAIRMAERFIYIEDQYLVSEEISRALVQALRKIQRLIILIPHGNITNMQNPVRGEYGEQVNFRRQRFIAPLRTPPLGSKVGVFFLSPEGNPGTYVHSKMMVVDDAYAIVGSANLNRRSLTHDSEAVVGIFDPSANSLARRLRIDLWAKHLNMNTTAGRTSLADGVASAKYWFAPPVGARPAGAHLGDYNENLNVEWDHPLFEWNEIDPDGS